MNDYNPESRKLLELALKACMVAGDHCHTEQVLVFARNHNYLLAVDEQTIWFIVYQTQKSRSLAGKFKLLQLALQHDIIYKIKVTDQNRNAVYSPQNSALFRSTNFFN